MGLQAKKWGRWQRTKIQSPNCSEGISIEESPVNFDEIFAPVMKMTSIRTVLSIATRMDLEIEQLDVKTTFLHRELVYEIYMQQPKGFEEKGKENLVSIEEKLVWSKASSTPMA